MQHLIMKTLPVRLRPQNITFIKGLKEQSAAKTVERERTMARKSVNVEKDQQ